MSSQEEKDMAEAVTRSPTESPTGKQDKPPKQVRKANNHLLLKPKRQGKIKHRPTHIQCLL